MKPLGSDMEELDRMDFRTRSPIPAGIQEKIADRLEAELDGVNAVVIVDQFDSADEGLISGYLLGRICQMSEKHPDKLFYADSRARPGDFAGMTVKCNHLEAALSAGIEPHANNMPEIARRLLEKTRKPAYITCGERGVIASGYDGATLSPAVPAEGPIDIVGAGDAASGGIIAALCSGAPPFEAAFFANLVSSITIKKLGVTGTASPDEIIAAAGPFAGLSAVKL
jgi:bifunctional ADP-heptose synthase (sugar kinase/adenylyltransferase)